MHSAPRIWADIDLMKLGALVSGYLTLVGCDPDYPVFVPRLSLFENMLVPNTDTRYMGATIDGKGTYRLRGERGSVPLVDLAVRGPYTMQPDKVVRTFADYDFDTLHLDDEGRFDVLLGPERPADHVGDYWYLDPLAEVLSLRIVSDDWGRQVDPRVTIQRLDTPSRRARRSPAELYDRIDRLPIIWSSARACG